MSRTWSLPAFATALSVALTVAVAALHIPYPLMGDQALFLIGAMELAEGRTLYVDFWDNKQPGIYWFYSVAGQLLGFDRIAVHSFEAAWLLLAAGLLTWAVGLEARHRWIAMLAPLLTVGLLYWNAGIAFMTQVEVLVSLPISMCLALGAMLRRAPAIARWCAFAFGASAALVAIFKLVLVVVPVSIWLVLAWRANRVDRQTILTVVRKLLVPAVIGGALVLGAVVLYFATRGAFDEFVWTTFTYPAMAAEEVAGKSWRQLAGAGRWLIWIVIPLLPLSIFVIRDLQREALRLTEAMALAWMLSGLAAILVQWFSWWAYHFCLLVIPIGLLATSALDRAATRMAGRFAPRTIGIMVLALAALPFVAAPREGGRALNALRKAFEASDSAFLEEFQSALDPRGQQMRGSIAFLGEPDARPGAIYVFGDPRIVLESRRRYAIPTHGWSWEMLVSAQWRALAGQLKGAMPVYVYVDQSYESMIAYRSPDTQRLLAEAYEVVRQDPAGTWFVRRL